MDTNVLELSKLILSKGDIIIANEIINNIENNNRIKALEKLAKVLGFIPKRPLYYIYHSVLELPKYGTRDIVRYSGDYIDQLIGFSLWDLQTFLDKILNAPLGPKINKFKKYIDENFYQALILFNKIYVLAKHNFNHTEDKSLFNIDDAVYIIYITKNIANKILPLSKRARDYNNQKQTIHYCSPKD